MAMAAVASIGGKRERERNVGLEVGTSSSEDVRISVYVFSLCSLSLSLVLLRSKDAIVEGKWVHMRWLIPSDFNHLLWSNLGMNIISRRVKFACSHVNIYRTKRKKKIQKCYAHNRYVCCITNYGRPYVFGRFRFQKKIPRKRLTFSSRKRILTVNYNNKRLEIDCVTCCVWLLCV